ncbi:MAG: Ig-like domain-containing protein [Planctomycetes bacterium]|nr:Ig-like domain-containing protein [Planctomycetota bacterium]
MNDLSATKSSPAPRPVALAFLTAVTLGASALTGCDRATPAPNSSNTPGTVLVNPATGKQFVVDPNSSGQADRIKLTGAFWGRLVDVYDVNDTLLFEDFVIGDNIASDLINYRLDRNSITEAETLTILHPFGTPEFDAKFADLDRNLQPVRKNGTTIAPTAILTAIPRNATLLLTFDDLLDAGTITPKDIAVLTGYPPVQPYEARVVPDPSHGDLFDSDGDGTPEFHTTRVLIDTTVSQLEAQQSNPPLPVNSLGLPEAQVTNQPNVLVRIPTSVAPGIGQLDILSNLTGAGMAPAANSPFDAGSATADVVRSMRSSSADVGDPNNGFLIDDIAPRIVGVQGVTLQSVQALGGTSYLITATFDAASCAPTPAVGDVIRVGSSALAVVSLPGSAPAGGLVTDVLVDLQVGDSSTFLPGQAQYLMPFDPTASVPPPCFVRISPTPSPAIFAPGEGVVPNSTITIRFSEPMDPASISGFETFAVTRISNANSVVPLGNTIVGVVQPSLDLKEFTYSPQVPFERVPGAFPAGEEYRLTLVGGANGAIDLSGKPITDVLPAFNFRLDPGAGASQTKGFVFKFNSADEDGNGAPEIRGQFLFNLAKGTIRPRAVARFNRVADATQPVLGIQVPFTAPIQTPLSNLGSKMMILYRYHDLGFSVVDDSALNLDIEGLSWAPFSGLQVDSYDRFRMAFSHCKFLPDEIIDPMSLLPVFPLSGVVKTFDSNILSTTNDPLKIVHPKDSGYDVQPVDSFVASTGTLMMPYPMNRGLPTTQFTRYTWRDTGLLDVGGPSGSGADTNINGFAQGITPIKLYAVNKVPSIALPLLMEFRCYPDDSAFGLNGFKVNIALNSSARPAFRAFSTGGVLSTGALSKIDPDNEPNAKGGINPATGQPTGFGTEIDPVVYLGQMDFVVRVNRVHTIWIDTLQFTAQFQTPLTEPPNSLQPAGTQVIVALRAASNVTNGTAPTGGVVPRLNANSYDPYGDPRAAVVVPTNFSATFPIGPGGVPDNTWKTNLASLNNLRFIQARITMLSNPDTLLFPELSGMGFSLRY